MVARHNALTEASLRIAACGGVAATREPHVKQLPQRPRATGLPALSTRSPPAPSASGHMPARASPAAPGIPHPTPASAVPSTLHGIQAPHPPVPSASAALPTPGDTAAAGQSAAVAPGATGIGLSSSGLCRRCTQRGSGHCIARRSPSPRAQHPRTHRCGNSRCSLRRRHRHDTAPATLPARPQRGDLLLYLPVRPVVVDVCVTHPLASSAVAAAAWGTGVSAEAKDAFERGKYGRTGTGACRFVTLFHETYGRAGPPAFALLQELPEPAASTGAVSKKIFMENAMRDLSKMLHPPSPPPPSPLPIPAPSPRYL